jgi:hypothetical protein
MGAPRSASRRAAALNIFGVETMMAAVPTVKG